MTRTRRPLLALIPLAILVGSCVGNDDPTGVGGSELRFDIRVSPALVPSAADATAAPINRIRARVARIPDNVVLGETVVDVSPSDEEWEVMLEATVTGESTEATLFVYLINTSGDVESVEFSGLVGPITLVAGEAFDAPDIPIIRGPIENSFVTGITISSAPDTLLEGSTATLEADVSTSAETQPTVFWTVLDSAGLSAADADVTALAPGLGRVVASAGAFADTASIVVIPAPATVVVSPATASVIGVGAQTTYTAVVLDARGDTLTGETVTWRSGTPGIISSLGDGLFEAVAIGDGVVEAVSASDATVVGTAAMVVGGASADVAVTKAASLSDVEPGDTIDFEIVVTNESLDVLVGIRVADTIPADLTVQSTTPTGTPIGSTWTWTLDTLAAGAVDTITVRASVNIGAIDGTRTNVVTVAPPVGFADPDATDNRAEVSFDVTAVVAERVDVVVLKSVDEPQPLEDSTVVFTVSVVNNGPTPVSNVAVFDTLESVFLSPVHVLSTGALADDSLWTISTLAVGDTATWTTTATVATGVAGGSASNTAFLRSLSENDSTPANDTMVVAIDFPLSAVPVVQITSPADSAVFDPGDLVTFTGTASDPEDGPLSTNIVWASSLDGQLGTGGSVETTQLTTGVHEIVASVSDSDGGMAADSISITIALYSVPLTLNVPFSGTASLPISLSEPAPAGGVTLSVAADDPSITGPTTPSVFIMEGQQSVNATLQGLLPGTTTVRVSNAQFGVVTTVVSVTAELDIQRPSFTMARDFIETITIQFESQGVPIAAPPGGLPVTLTLADPGCVAAPPSVTIPAGLINTTASVTYGGSAALSCASYLYATSPGVVTDSVAVTVVAPPVITVGSRTIGSGLHTSTSSQLPLSNHGGVTVRITSSDPQVMLVSPNGTTAGSAFIDVAVNDGASSVSYWVQGVEEATGTVTITASAPGFTDGTNTITVVQPGIVLSGLNATTTTLTGDDDFYAQIGLPSGSSISAQAIRAGGNPVTVTFTTDDTGVGLLTDGQTSGASVSAVIPVLAFRSPTTVAAGGTAHDPIGVGTATITTTTTAPGVLLQPDATRSVTVSAPGITVGSRTIGSGLHTSTSSQLLASNHGGVTVRITSSDPQVMLVSPNGTTAGSAFIDVVVNDGATSVSYWVQGVEEATGTVTITASAPGFTDGTNTITVVQPGIVLSGLNATTTTLTGDDDFYAQIGLPSGSSISAQAIRAGGNPVTVTFTTDDTGVGLLTDGQTSGASVSAVIPVLAFRSPTTVAAGGTAHDPIGVGTATITTTTTAPGVLLQPDATRSVTVSAPGITVGSRTIGSGLHTSTSSQLLASNHGGVTVRITSSDPQVMLVSPNGTTAGSAFIDVAVNDGATSVSYWVQGVEEATGTVTITASAPGFTDGTNTITVVQPGIVLSGLNATTTTLTGDDDFYAQIGLPSGSSISAQAIRAGGNPVTVTFTTDDTGVGLLTDGQTSGASVSAVIPVLAFRSPTTVAAGGTAHDPIGVGTATITTTTTAPGVLLQPDATRSVTVSAPGITVGSRTIGSGLHTSTSSQLLASNHGGVTVRITSSNPQVMLVSPNGTTAGSAFIDVVVNDGATSVPYWVQGVEQATGTVTITASAPGFTDGTNTITVVQPGIVLSGLNSTSTVGAPDDDFYAQIGLPSGSSISAQAIRAGGNPVTVTFTTDDTGVGLLTDGQTSGASVSAVIPVLAFRSPTTVAAGGTAHDPIDVGTATITTTTTAPGVLLQPDATRSVTINP